jgi:hypothetical protein
MSDHIEKIPVYSSKERFIQKMKKFLNIKLIAYGVSGAIGAGTGLATQQLERGVSGYDPVSHQKLSDELTKKEHTSFDDFKKEKAEKEKQSIKEWSKDMLSKIKSRVLNPKEYIKSTDVYKTLQLRYLDTLKFIDDVSFIVPALLMFIMLGGYMSRKLTSMAEHKENKEEREAIIAKINELVDASNILLDRITSEGVESLTASEVAQLRTMLLQSKEVLDGDDESSH